MIPRPQLVPPTRTVFHATAERPEIAHLAAPAPSTPAPSVGASGGERGEQRDDKNGRKDEAAQSQKEKTPSTQDRPTQMPGPRTEYSRWSPRTRARAAEEYDRRRPRLTSEEKRKHEWLQNNPTKNETHYERAKAERHNDERRKKEVPTSSHAPQEKKRQREATPPVAGGGKRAKQAQTEPGKWLPLRTWLPGPKSFVDPTSVPWKTSGGAYKVRSVSSQTEFSGEIPVLGPDGIPDCKCRRAYRKKKLKRLEARRRAEEGDGQEDEFMDVESDLGSVYGDESPP